MNFGVKSFQQYVRKHKDQGSVNGLGGEGVCDTTRVVKRNNKTFQQKVT